MHLQRTTPYGRNCRNIGLIFAKLDTWLDGIFGLLPHTLMAIIVAVIFWIIGLGIGQLANNIADKRGRDSLGDVARSLVRWAIAVIGFMLAITIIAPSITPGVLLAG